MLKTEALKKIVDSNWFNNFIICTILLAGILVGIQTYGERVAKWLDFIHFLDLLILLIFTLEAAIKILAEGDKPQNYFTDPWNIFDFLIVVICWAALFFPAMNAGYVAVFRLARVLRVLRLVSVMPQLKLIVDALLKSIPSMGYVGILLLLLFYIYGAMGVFLFKANNPTYFGDLGTSIISLFQISTMEGWTDILYVNMFGCDHEIFGMQPCDNPQPKYFSSLIYFISFVLIGTMIILNLFIGVILNSMDEVRNEQMLEEQMKAQKEGQEINILSDFEKLQLQLDEMKKQLDFIAFKVEKKD